MKKSRKLIAVIAIVGIMGTAGTAFAATATTPAEIVSGLTGKSVEDLYVQRSAGTTYGTIAKDAGKLDEFQAQMLEQKKILLDQRVAEKSLTQAQADEIYNDIKDNQATCDGTGTDQIGQKFGVGFGNGAGNGTGLGNGTGRGHGMGQGMGFGSGMGRGAGNGNGNANGCGAGNCLNQ
jgi:hypothetical protein